ncbi:MAG: HAD-IA family hydrolase [Legionellaceae bacterium]|nr:HAD-IA family hydrolase [Legionellaceae bacterium]MBP9774714.1 HAD-IA family hydrolase [Legionellaceae bacterium]
MLQRYQLVVFDWEGTIAESGLGYMIIALAKAAERLHLPNFDLSTARLTIRYGLATAVKKLFPTISSHQQEDLCAEVQTALFAVSAKVALISGVAELIQWLHQSGMQLAIATNKSAQGLARVLRISGLEPYIHITRSASEVPAKPCPQMLEEIMTACGVSAQQTLMVGDSSSDMEMARALDVYAIGMDFFQMEEPMLRAAGANDVMHDYQQLLQYIKDN